MSEWNPATKRQLNYIQVLARDHMTPDTFSLDDYFNLRKLTPDDLCKGEASDLIECFDSGRSKVAFNILKHTLKDK